MPIFQRKDSPYWWYSFKLPGQRQVLASTQTTDRKLAEKIYHAKRSDYQQIQHGFERQKVKLEELADDYLELYAKHSKASYKHNIGQFSRIKKYFGNVYLYEITPDKLEAYRAFRLSQEVAKPTVNREMALLKHAFNKAIEWNKAKENPVEKIKFYSEKERKRVRYLEMEEKRRLLNACPSHIKSLVFFALNTGMRQGEILGLKWEEIDFNLNQVRVSHSKAGKPRYVPINSELVNMVKSISGESVYVFGKGQEKPKWPSFRGSFEAAVKRAGLDDFRFHDLRHCYASDLVMKGVDLKTLAELLGHSTTQMTERYAHLSPARLRAAVELLPTGLLNEGHGGKTDLEKALLR